MPTEQKVNCETVVKVERRTYAFANANSQNLSRWIGEKFPFLTHQKRYEICVLFCVCVERSGRHR